MGVRERSLARQPDDARRITNARATLRAAQRGPQNIRRGFGRAGSWNIDVSGE